MKRLIILILAVLMLLPCAGAEADNAGLSDHAHSVCTRLISGKYAEVVEEFDANMQAAADAQALEQIWNSVLQQFGSFVAVEAEKINEDLNAAILTLRHENGSILLTIVFDDDQGKISGLSLRPAQTQSATERALPEGALEKQTVLFSGTEQEISAMIVSPKSVSEKTPYLLLVHGSGASDMDETIGPNKPFRDLAYDLAELGIASMRFDKVTYAHPDASVETVEQEYLFPVTEALRVLKEETGAAAVYVAGHSQGGILTPWLVQECGFSGGIVLAGTPRPIWEMSYDQNLAIIASMPKDQQTALLSQVESEYKRALRLNELSDEEAKKQTVFGMNAYYLQYMERLNQIEIVKATQKPYLFLWGEADFQVSRDAFNAWRDGLGDGSAYTYITYPGLNHLFLPAAEGDSIANVQTAYARAANMDPSVAKDIAQWINGQEAMG